MGIQARSTLLPFHSQKYTDRLGCRRLGPGNACAETEIPKPMGAPKNQAFLRPIPKSCGGTACSEEISRETLCFSCTSECSRPALKGCDKFSFVRLVHRYYGTVRPLRSVRASRMAFCLLWPGCSASAGSQFGGLLILVHEVSSRARGLRLRGAHVALAFAHDVISPSPCVHWVGAPILVFRSSIPCPPAPLFTLRAPPRDEPRKTRGQDGSLLLSCKTLSFSTSCRFIPAHGRCPVLIMFLLNINSVPCTRQRPQFPGHIVINPDFAERAGDFGFLWFESEYAIDAASIWI